MSEEENEFTGPDFEVVDPYEAVENDSSETDTTEEKESSSNEINEKVEISEEQKALLEENNIDVDDFSRLVFDQKLAESLINAMNVSKPAAPEKESSFDIDLNESFYDPEIVAQFRSMKQHYDQEIAGLRDQLLSMNKISESSKTSLMFDKLNQPERFGSGVVDSNTKEGKNRRMVLDEVEALKAGYQAKGRALPSDDQMLAKAINLVFGEQMAEHARQEFSNKVEQRHNSRIARPNTRVSKPNNKVAEATRNVAALMRDRGLGGSTDSFE